MRRFQATRCWHGRHGPWQHWFCDFPRCVFPFCGGIVTLLHHDLPSGFNLDNQLAVSYSAPFDTVRAFNLHGDGVCERCVSLIYVNLWRLEFGGWVPNIIDLICLHCSVFVQHVQPLFAVCCSSNVMCSSTTIWDLCLNLLVRIVLVNCHGDWLRLGV